MEWIWLLIGYLTIVALILMFFKGCSENEDFQK